ncbi:MAG: 2-succinyl-5-enolpyruvyl-6-hydroxy-3-cyclohexene-1-carboxylic-acid synthase [Chloroflexota bacterium]
MSDAATLRALVEELVAAGVRDAVVCPGSRSTPLALALRTAPGIRVRVLLDERSAAFFALGLARTDRRPVALLSTSGTAAVEFGPATVEASLSRVPLLVLTADRPVELRDRGAPQTIDQDHLFGRAAKWFTELPLFDGAPATTTHVRSIAGRAVATAAAGPAGPVHLNIPLREPLLPDAPLVPEAPLVPDAPLVPAAGAAPGAVRVPAPFTDVVAGRRSLDASMLEVLADRIGSAERGLILAGPDDDPALPEGLASLAAATGFPIIADPLSGLRAGRHDRSSVVIHADQLTRPGPWSAAHRPTLVLRTGAMPTSKPVLEFLVASAPDLLVLDSDAGWREAALLPVTFVHADAAVTAAALAGIIGSRRVARDDGAWRASWLAADRAADAAMRGWLAGLAEPFEGSPFPVLADLLPDGSVLWVGNSMPVRDLDGWFGSVERSITVRSNRGANGIDGVVSTALGSAAAAAGPVVLVVGDVSFLHDLNALVAARLHGLSATIVLVNNDGGGIFSFLPQATVATPGLGLPEHYEELYGTPHGIDVGPIVTSLGGEHRQVEAADLGDAMADSIGRLGVRVLELRTNRARNVELHREVAGVVARALARALAAEPGPA